MRVGAFLAGLMLLSTAALVGSNGLQANPGSSTPGTAPVPPGSPSAASPASGGGAQQTTRIEFTKDQKNLCLRLRQDQTVATWVEVVIAPGPDKTGAGQMNSPNPTSPVVAPPKFYIDMEGSRNFSPCTASAATLLGDASWNPEKSRGIPILITSCRPHGGSGDLVIVGSTGQRKIRVTLKPRRSMWLSFAIITSLVLAISMCLIAARVVLSQGHEMTDEMGGASWDFSSSWASNITAFGTAFTFLLQLIVFPDKPFFGTRAEYMFVAALATAIVAFAPAMHRLISASIPAPSAAGSGSVPEGVVGGFLAASVFTLWGAFLQCGLELLVILDLIRTATVYSPVGIVAVLAVGIGAVALIIYCANMLLSTIALNAARSGKPTAAVRAKFAADPLSAAQARMRKVPVL